MNKTDIIFGKNVRFLRSFYGINKQEFAWKIDVSVNTLKCIEEGRPNRYFRARHLKRVRDYFGISADILLNYDLEKMLKERDKN